MECPICLELINTSENTEYEFKTECCNQVIHEDCFNKSLVSTKGKCPFCRTERNLIITVNNELFNNEITINNIQPRRIDGLEFIKIFFAFIFSCLMIFVLFILPSLYAIVAINQSKRIIIIKNNNGTTN